MKRLISISLLLLAIALPGCTPAGAAGQASGTTDLRVRKGDLADHFLLTGELEAAEGAVIAVPRLPSWQTSLKWMAPEGVELAEGDPVVELDNSEFATSLDQKRSALLQTEHELAQKQAELKASLAESQHELDRRAKDLEKAKLDAAVPADLMARREYEDRKLALERAQTEFQKAKSSYDAARTSGVSEIRNLELARAVAEREARTAEDAIQTLTLRAPRRGIVVVSEHPWEGRKLQVGDGVFVSMMLAQIPDLSTLQVVGSLPDVDDGKIAAGMPVTMTIDAFPDRSFQGTVREIAPVAQEIGRGSLRRGFRVVVPIDQIDIERMRPGLSVRLTVDRGMEKGALLVSRAALDPERKLVRLANGRERAVEIGRCNAQECLVKSGVDEGTRVRPWWAREAAE